MIFHTVFTSLAYLSCNKITEFEWASKDANLPDVAFPSMPVNTTYYNNNKNNNNNSNSNNKWTNYKKNTINE